MVVGFAVLLFDFVSFCAFAGVSLVGVLVYLPCNMHSFLGIPSLAAHYFVRRTTKFCPIGKESEGEKSITKKKYV